MRKPSGFTLVEALVVLAILALLATFSVRISRDAVLAGHAASGRSALSETLLAALNQSTISQSKVVVCASTDRKTCSGGVDWSAGWTAFIDADGDRQRGDAETIVRTHQGLYPGIRLVSSVGRTRIVFQPYGGVNAGSNVTFTFCDARGAAKASTIILANSGRMRTAPATPAQAQACLGEG